VLFRQLFSSITRIDEAQKRLEEKFEAMLNKLEDISSVSEAQQGEALRNLEDLKIKSTVKADDELLKTIEDRLMKLEHRPMVIEEAQQRLSQDGGWSRVFVHQDLTLKQREARKPLKARKARRAEADHFQQESCEEERFSAQSGELVCFYINARNLIGKMEQFESWCMIWIQM